MKKTILLLLIFSLCLFSGCAKKENAMILFSSNTIDRNFDLSKNETVFTTAQRINFVLLNPNPFTSDILRLQILISNIKTGSFLDIAQARDIEIDPNKHYAMGSFCVYRDGKYIVRIFSKDDLDVPLAEANIWVNPQ